MWKLDGKVEVGWSSGLLSFVLFQWFCMVGGGVGASLSLEWCDYSNL